VRDRARKDFSTQRLSHILFAVRDSAFPSWLDQGDKVHLWACRWRHDHDVAGKEQARICQTCMWHCMLWTWLWRLNWTCDDYHLLIQHVQCIGNTKYTSLRRETNRPRIRNRRFSVKYLQYYVSCSKYSMGLVETRNTASQVWPRNWHTTSTCTGCTWNRTTIAAQSTPAPKMWHLLLIIFAASGAYSDAHASSTIACSLCQLISAVTRPNINPRCLTHRVPRFW